MTDHLSNGEDALGILDTLGADRAHIVRRSMAGGIGDHSLHRRRRNSPTPLRWWAHAGGGRP